MLFLSLCLLLYALDTAEPQYSYHYLIYGMRIILFVSAVVEEVVVLWMEIISVWIKYFLELEICICMKSWLILSFWGRGAIYSVS